MNSCFKFGEIVLPKNMNVESWGIVACDQYTSNRAYWDGLYKNIKGVSALHLIFPEVYLNDPDKDRRIAAVIDKQREYVADGVFEPVEGAVMLQRRTAYGNLHSGLMLLVNLDDYSVSFLDKPLIRPTEAVVPERIPPRVAIRKDCPLELPHIMLLFDDPTDSVMTAAKESAQPLYRGKLNSNGGEIEGYSIADTTALSAALNGLKDSSTTKYGEPVLFLVGDGNHSLATAKACVDEQNPLSRYALVEAVNIYDEGIKFEPIHRAVFDVDVKAFTAAYEAYMNAETGMTELITADGRKPAKLPDSAVDAVKKTDEFIEAYIKQNGGRVDYIHGESELVEVAKSQNGVGVILKKMPKEALFPHVVKLGALPKKTFSMGEADEKRYYIEARKIK